jgi:hypothetical protein
MTTTSPRTASGKPQRIEPLVAVDSPAAWVGTQMKHSDTWIYQLSEVELAELDAALRQTQGRGLGINEIGKGDFPLPTLGARLAEIQDEILNGRGFVLIRGIPVERYSIAEAATVYWGIGSHIGKARSQNAKGHVLGHVCNLGYDPADPNVRIYQTTERQTYHSDSVDIVGLLCLKPAKKGGLSSIVSSVTIHNEMVKRRPDLARLLYEGFTVDRRGEVPAGRKPYFTVPIFNDYDGYLTTTYVRRYIESAQRFDEVPRLTDAQREALDLFDTLAEDPELHLDMEFKPGDVQLLCNHTILHDRTAYEDWPEPERRRHLLRLWLCPPNGRPLPPAFIARYGSIEIGDRGGIVVPGAELNAPLEPT